jgi:PAS domain S-box-containing protein
MNNDYVSILLVEDNPGDARLVKELLKDVNDCDLKLKHASNFDEFKILYKESKTDIILLDLFLPESKGLDTLDYMIKEAPDVPIIVLSGMKEKSIAINAVKLGAQDYLIKGAINGNLLERAIFYAIERHRIKKETENLTKALQDSEARLNMLFQKAPFAVILHDLIGNILNVNKEAENLFLYHQDEFLSKNLKDILDKKDFQSLIESIHEQLNESSFNTKITAVIKNKLNTIIHVEISSSILKSKDQIVVETYFSNISERVSYDKNRKFLIDQLLNSLEAKATFFSAMSHDLRTPLNAIIGFSELLLEGMYGILSQKQIEFLRDIKGSAEELLTLVNHVLDFSEIESGLFKLNIINFQLLPVINDLIYILNPKIKSKGLSFYLEGIKKNTKIRGDLLKFKQILYNLFENAIKYTEKGSFTFKAIERTDHWEFQVSDTGLGISVCDYDTVFREFERIEGDIKKPVSGAGLGLALTRRLIQLHNGEIWFESEIKKGTTFFFTIAKNL